MLYIPCPSVPITIIANMSCSALRAISTSMFVVMFIAVMFSSPLWGGGASFVGKGTFEAQFSFQRRVRLSFI